MNSLVSQVGSSICIETRSHTKAPPGRTGTDEEWKLFASDKRSRAPMSEIAFFSVTVFLAVQRLPPKDRLEGPANHDTGVHGLAAGCADLGSSPEKAQRRPARPHRKSNRWPRKRTGAAAKPGNTQTLGRFTSQPQGAREGKRETLVSRDLCFRHLHDVARDEIRIKSTPGLLLIAE